jgi:glycosyltransferase involved in cell wall biosynthesis
VRFVHPRWTSLNAALGRADAELYYQNCAEHATGQVAWWCRRNGRRFVYSVASNPDCDPRLPELHSLRERLLYRYGLRHADCVIVQTEQQRRVLFEGFALKSSRLPMPCPGPSDLEFTSSKAFPEPFRVAWVGRISPVKRLEMMLEVAEKLPEIQFEVAGKPDESDPAYAAALLGRAAKIKNLKVNGPIPMDAMNGFYRKMSLLCCTSAYEGFPNTFLEAWSHGLPVVSTVDPDNLIAERNLGAWAPSAAGIAAAIRRFRESPADRQSASANSRRYYSENHSVEPAMLKFEKLFLETLNGGGRS